MTDDELRRLALAASPGDWQAVRDEKGHPCVVAVVDPPHGWYWVAEMIGMPGKTATDAGNAAFVAAASPATVLRLLDRLSETDPLAQMASALGEVGVEDLGQARAAVHSLVPSLAQLLAILFLREDGSPWNHLVWRVGGAPAPVGEIELVAQRVDGETPAQQRDAAKAEAAELRAALEAYGGHDAMCPQRYGRRGCTCGWNEARAVLDRTSAQVATDIAELYQLQAEAAGVRLALGASSDADIVTLVRQCQEREAGLRDALERIREGAAAGAGRCMNCDAIASLAAQALDAEVRNAQ